MVATAKDPRAPNARAFAIDARGLVVGMLLQVAMMPGAPLRAEHVALVDEERAQGRVVLRVSVKGLSWDSVRPVLAWPWVGGGLPQSHGRAVPEWTQLEPGKPFEHVISSSFNPREVEAGPLALYLEDRQGNVVSDFVGGFGLPNGRHVSFEVVYGPRDVHEPEDDGGDPERPVPPLGPQLLPYVPWDVIHMFASVGAGEARSIPGGVYAVVSTMVGRLLDPRWGNTAEEVLSAYFAEPLEPTPDELSQAIMAWFRPIPDVRYAFSRQDLVKLQVDPGQADYRVEYMGWGLYLFSQWPVGK